MSMVASSATMLGLLRLLKRSTIYDIRLAVFGTTALQEDLAEGRAFTGFQSDFGMVGNNRSASDVHDVACRLIELVLDEV